MTEGATPPSHPTGGTRSTVVDRARDIAVSSVLAVVGSDATAAAVRRSLRRSLGPATNVATAAGTDEALTHLATEGADIVLVGVDGTGTGDRAEPHRHAGLHQLVTLAPTTPVVTMGRRLGPAAVDELVRSGAEDHVELDPLDDVHLARAVRLAVVRHDARRPDPAQVADGIRAGRRADHEAAERQRISTILERSREVALFFGPDGLIEWVGTNCSVLLGVSPANLLGTNGQQLCHPDDLRVVRRSAAGLLRRGARTTVEFRVVRPDGSVAVLEANGDHLDAGYSAGSVLVTVRDVTERRRAEESIRFQADLLSAVGQAVVATDRQGRITYMNAAAEELYGWAAADAMGLDGGAISVADREGDGAEILARQIASGRAWEGELWLRRRDGTEFCGRVTNTPLSDADGEILGLIGVTTDLTDQLELARAAEADRDRLVDAQHSAHLGSFECDLVAGTVHFSDELFRMLGLVPGSPVEPGTYRERIHPDDLAGVDAAAAAALEGREGVDHEHRIVRPDGTVRWVHARNSSSPEHPEILRGTVLDVTERREAEERLEYEVRHDPLTGLANRVEIARRLETHLEAQRGGGPALTLAFLDLDRFKVINDGLGHATGDEVLLEVGRRLSGATGSLGTVGRFSGDEFVVLLPGDHRQEIALDLVETLVSCLDEPIEVDRRRFFLSASVGVTTSTPTDTADSLLQAADTAMYESKRSPRRRISYFDTPLAQRARRGLAIETDLRQAIENHELELNFQPIVGISNGRCEGVESLLRWNHPRLGRVSPDDFITVAEETGMIVPIGEWVLTESLRHLRHWQSLPGLEDLWIAVNVSASQLTRIDLDLTVAAALAQEGIRPEHLHLEITESVLMDRIDGSMDTLEALRAIGAHLSVDDFGTGYSSLSYLKMLPVQTLKIDRTFVDGLGDDPHDTSIVQAIVGLAEALGLELLAEGVETTRQSEELQRLGCRLGQGYLWAAPLSRRHVDAYLRSRLGARR